MDHVIALRQISVTALFYLEDSRKIHLRGVKAGRSKDTRRRAPQHAGRRERQLWLLFLRFFLPPRPALCKLGLVRSAVLPAVLTLVLRPSFVLFLWAFPFLVFQPQPFWTPVFYSNYLTGLIIKLTQGRLAGEKELNFNFCTRKSHGNRT